MVQFMSIINTIKNVRFSKLRSVYMTSLFHSYIQLRKIKTSTILSEFNYKVEKRFKITSIIDYSNCIIFNFINKSHLK